MRLPDGLRWRLVIIDNNSSDSTSAIVDEFRTELPIEYRFESEQGLSSARNNALRATAGCAFVLFTDDDVVVDAQWLASYFSAFALFPDAGYYGGRVLPFYPAGKPRWLHDESLALIDGLLVRFDLGVSTRRFAAVDPTPFGASFALSRRCIDAVGEFRLDLGVSGNVPGRGEETNYIQRAKGLGCFGVYVGQSLVKHETDPKRLTLSYMYRYGIQTGIAERVTSRGELSSSIGHEVVFLLRGLVQALRGRGDRARQCVINMGILRGRRA
jgi:glycosyltransferase involved in cell wall biosynthesis